MDDFQSTQIGNSRLPRRTYLITYSQADLLKFPSRKEFEKCIKNHFNKGSGKVKVQRWACSLEKHQNGGNHYHVALKLTGPNVGSLQRKASHHQRGLWSTSQINMTTTTLLIDTSARKIHQSTTVNTTLIWKIYPPHEPRSQQKLTGTLAKLSPPTPLQLQNHLPKSCRTQKVNPSASPD